MFGKSQKEPQRLKEDLLEVGLERHRKATKGLPVWLTEYGGWLLICLVALVVIGPLWLMRDAFDIKPMPVAPAVQLTVGEPTLAWLEGSISELRSVKVSVANSSAVDAQGVRVVAVIREQAVVLSGPQRIQSGSSAVFAGAVAITFRSGDPFRIDASCINCR
jgi:hypothetical protein